MFVSTVAARENGIERGPPADDAPQVLQVAPLGPAAQRQPVWSVSIDNDLFAPGNRDRDYTGGVTVAVSGTPTDRLPWPVGRLRAIVDRAAQGAGARGAGDGVTLGGLIAFTPEDIGSSTRIAGERPYASLAYVGASATRVDLSRQAVSQSTLIVGLLGTPIAEQLQSAIHRRTGATEPSGYRHQIADGGELTARFSFARHVLVHERSSGRRRFDTRASVKASVGYLTELSAGFAVRWGRITSPWWTSGFEYAGYDLHANPVVAGAAAGGRESYIFAGVRLRARIYNALLQGQFRESPVTLSFDQTRPILGDVWLGLATRTGRLSVSYMLRFQSAEVRRGVAARNISWASISIARSIRR